MTDKNKNNKKLRKEQLTAIVRSEIQKSQTQSVCLFLVSKEIELKAEKLKQDLVVRDKIQKNNENPGQKLLDRIDETKERIEDLEIEEISLESSTHLSINRLDKAIFALRKIDPKLANEFQNMILVKSTRKKNRTAIKHKRKA